MTSRNVLELRSALERLADGAPTTRDLDHRPWTAGAVRDPRGRRPLPGVGRLAVAVSVIVVLAVAAAIGVAVSRGGDSGPPAGHARTALEVRPLIAPAVALSASGPRSADPLRGLAFSVPASEADYDRLSVAQRQQLSAALARTDCARQAPSDAPTRVACTEPAGGPRTALLLGPAILGDAGVADARAVAPAGVTGNVQWTVAITLDRRATAAWSSYTRLHHATGNPGAVGSTACASTRVPCADFVAFVVGGKVLSLPITMATLGSRLQLAGDFTQAEATRLARALAP